MRARRLERRLLWLSSIAQLPAPASTVNCGVQVSHPLPLELTADATLPVSPYRRARCLCGLLPNCAGELPQARQAVKVKIVY